MTGKGIIVLVLALVGIAGPYLIASRVLNSLYDPTVSGSAAPLPAQIEAYSIATLVAVIIFILAAWKLRRLTQSSPPASIPEEDELPY